MRAGLLKYHIQILSKTTARDEYGSEQETWSVLHAVRADVRDKSGTKQDGDFRIFNSQSIEINIRYISGINETMRVKLDERVYKIVFISESEYRRALMLTVERIPDE